MTDAREALERRAKHCTTHHYACDCRELDLAKTVDRLVAHVAERDQSIATLTAQVAELRADAERLEWLQSNEFDLVTRREDIGDDEYAIWWFVVDSRKSTARHLHTVSGHPLGSPREAIDAARAAIAKEKP